MTEETTTKEHYDKDSTNHNCSSNRWYKEAESTVKTIKEQIKKLIKEGNLRSVVVKSKEGKILLQTPLTAGIVGSIVVAQAFPMISAISMILILFTSVKVIITKKDGSEVHLTT